MNLPLHWDLSKIGFCTPIYVFRSSKSFPKTSANVQRAHVLKAISISGLLRSWNTSLDCSMATQTWNPDRSSSHWLIHLSFAGWNDKTWEIPNHRIHVKRKTLVYVNPCFFPLKHYLQAQMLYEPTLKKSEISHCTRFSIPLELRQFQNTVS